MKFDDRKELVELGKALRDLAQKEVGDAREDTASNRVVAACALSWALGEVVGDLNLVLPGAEEKISAYLSKSYETGKAVGFSGLGDEDAAFLLGADVAIQH